MQQYTDRPYVICHMLTSLDGKIDGAFFSVPETFPALKKYGELRTYYDCPAILYGTTTMAQGYAEGTVSKLPSSHTDYPREDYVASSDVQNYIVSVDPKGILSWSSKYIERVNRPRAHVIEVLTEQVSKEYLAYLRSFDISYIFAGTKQLDCKMLLRKLKSLFGIDKVLLAGGGLINGSFLQEELIDELSIVLAPTADGNRTTATLFEKAEFLPQSSPAAFRLKAVEQIEEDTLWLRRRESNPYCLPTALFSAFHFVLLNLHQQICVVRSENRLKMARRQVLSSFGGANLGSDNDIPAVNTSVFTKEWRMYEPKSARQNQQSSIPASLQYLLKR